MVRLYRPDGDLDGEAKYVGLDLPDSYRMTYSLESAGEGLTEKAAERAAEPDDLPADPWTDATEG